MDEALEKALDFSNFTSTLNAQKRILFEKYLDELNTRSTEVFNVCILRFILIVHSHPCCTCKFMLQCQAYQRNRLNT